MIFHNNSTNSNDGSDSSDSSDSGDSSDRSESSDHSFFYYLIIGIKINVITNRNEERYVGR